MESTSSSFLTSVSKDTFIYVPPPDLTKLSPMSKEDMRLFVKRDPDQLSSEVLSDGKIEYVVSRQLGTLDFTLMGRRKIYEIHSSTITKFSVYQIEDIERIISKHITSEILTYRGIEYILVRWDVTLDYYLVLATDSAKKYFK